MVPAKLPRVLTAVSRPTLPPTPLTETVRTRIKKGQTIASKQSGMKNKVAEAIRLSFLAAMWARVAESSVPPMQ